jgi:N-acyl-D-amino-acid deacylase
LLSKTMARIENAEREAVDVSLDYCHFQPFYHPLPLHAVAPGWQEEPDYKVIQARLATQKGRDAVMRAYAGGWKSDLELNFPDAGWDYTILWAPGVEECVGQSIVELALERRLEPLEMCYELILRSTDPIIVSRVIHEDDIRAVLMSRQTMLSTDTYALDAPLPAHITLHPRNYGAYACFFGRYVRERKWMSLEEAVRRCTSLAASRFGLRDRGRILKGTAADLVVFSPDKIIDRSTVTEPTRLCDGVGTVVVNGAVAWERGRLVEGKAGEVIHA